MFVVTLLLLALYVACTHGSDKWNVGCGINVECRMNVSEMIAYYNYPVEVHDVVTEDGYILSVQRIPSGKRNVENKSEIVLLQHGFIDSAFTWVCNFPNQSLAYLLADEGYDVWLGNMRGNTYGKRHVNLSTDDSRFWSFTFDEMAKYDLPAIVDYILKLTGQSQLNYVGHSQGCLIGIIEFGRNITLAKKIKAFYALAPVATVSHIKGGMKILAGLAPEFKGLNKILGINELFSNSWVFKYLSDIVCALGHVTEMLCGSVVFGLCGYDKNNLNLDRIPIYTSHTPAGTSVRNAGHYVQMIKNGKFEMYDFGEEGNLAKYNQKTPPQYNISSMTTPISIFSGSNDWLATPEDINNILIPNLTNLIYRRNIEHYNHLDFTWGEDAHKFIYKDLIKLLKHDI